MAYREEARKAREELERVKEQSTRTEEESALAKEDTVRAKEELSCAKEESLGATPFWMNLQDRVNSLTHIVEEVQSNQCHQGTLLFYLLLLSSLLKLWRGFRLDSLIMNCLDFIAFV